MSVCKQAEAIKEALYRSLSILPRYRSCAFLGYPYSPNTGDHLVWLGAVSYLKDVLGTRIAYGSGCHNFSAARLEKEAPNVPLFLMGGGNLGDLYPYYENFRASLIGKYPRRPIVIFPQSIYFKDAKNLENTAAIYNRHPDLTLFVREDESEKIARAYFHRCRIVKSPDIAFQLAGSMASEPSSPKENSVLFLSRYGGPEFCSDFESNALDLPQVSFQDWTGSGTVFRGFYSLAHLETKGWRRRLFSVMKRAGWFMWPRMEAFRIGRAPLEDHSREYLRNAVRQLSRYRVIITDRLHAHILCVMLGIPHVLLPVSYHKNASFYRTWTFQVPFCRFVTDVSKVRNAVEELWGA